MRVQAKGPEGQLEYTFANKDGAVFSLEFYTGKCFCSLDLEKEENWGFLPELGVLVFFRI